MKKIFTILFILCFATIVFAQHTAKMSQYELNKNLINPAAITSKNINTNLFYRNQWTGLERAPKTVGLNISTKFNKMSFGLFILNDKAGVFNQNIIHLNYGYSLPVSREIFLQFGLSGGVNIYKIRFEELEMYHANDPNVLSQNTSVLLPDFNFGVFLSNQKDKSRSAFGSLAKQEPTFYVGASIQHLTGLISANKILSNESYLLRHFNLMGGVKHNVGELLQMEEIILFKYVSGVAPQMDIGFRLFYLNSYWTGLSYRSSNDMTAKIGILFNDILFGYSYDFNVSQIPNKNSHEIVLGFTFENSIFNNSKSPSKF